MDSTGKLTTEGGGRNRSIASLRSLLPYALQYRGRIVLAFIALCAASAATLALPLAVRRMIDYGFAGTGAHVINSYFSAMAVVVLVLALASACRYYLVMTLGERVVADVRKAVFAHLTRLSPVFYDQTMSGEILSRLTADTTQIKSAFGSSASVFLRNIFLFAGSLVMMIVTSPRLSAYVLFAIPVIVLPLVVLGRAIRARSRQAQDRLADAAAYAGEAIGAMRVVQAFTAESYAVGHFSTQVEQAYDAAAVSARSRALMTAIALFLVFSSIVAVLWLGAHEVIAGSFKAGELTQFVIYAVFGASSLSQLSDVGTEIMQAAGAAGRLNELFDKQPEVAVPASPVAFPDSAGGAINFSHVDFSYPGHNDRQVLKDINFSVKKGETVAIVGPSGSGKTTLFQLLLRFYDPSGGHITLDGVPLVQADPGAIRAQMAIVHQEPVVFATSVRENIRFGRAEATDAEVEAAARLAAADTFIKAMPQGYDTRIGERGVTLSGGQRQRMAIARAILRNAPVLLLDEATSSLDSESEHAVQQALKSLMSGRTTLVIAHRLSTIQAADRIIVLDAGQIVEQGRHDELVVSGGLYARLARLQFGEAA